MRPLSVVKEEPLPESLAQLGAIAKRAEIQVVVLERPPQPLDENVVLHMPPSIHADPDPMAPEQAREGIAGKLRSLIRVEDFRGAIAFYAVMRCTA